MSNPVEDDAALIERAQAGELGAFDALVRRHQTQVFAVALRMLGDRDEAQEIAQDAFVRAYRGLSAFRREAKLSTWLVSITMNLCRNRRRWWARRKRFIAASLDAAPDPDQEASRIDVADPSPDPSAIVERKDQARLVLEALQGLSASERAIVVLRDLEGHSYEEIAQVLRCQVGTVKSRLNRARWQLRALLDGKL
ncbi:MAG: sigma-70 family RNA polymerase sigma factor [Candidatus Omnitrophica bacterium]|nr:sigma-70 family RNA polymerase sigma factor [Candidatus Omnitrophota bacterium]